MTGLSIEAPGLGRLAADLSGISRDLLPTIRPVFQEAADELKTKWKANARETAGKHGRLYPDAITYETRVLAGSLYAEIGPDTAHPQGRMSFEYGSKNQPPHLDGQKAADEVVPYLERRVDSAIAYLLKVI